MGLTQNITQNISTSDRIAEPSSIFVEGIVQPTKQRPANVDFDQMREPSGKTLSQDILNKVSLQEDVMMYSWRQINMQGRVIGVKANMVQCECLLDPDERIFETRSFPKLLFENIPNLSDRPFVYISIRMKPGATRIDIADGSKRVDKKLFEINEKWDEILKHEISKPLTKPLGYDNNNV